MLQTIRDRLTGWVAAFVILVIGLALTISFGNMNTDAVTANSAASVNGEDIPLPQFRQVYQTQLIRQQEQLQGEFPDELIGQLQQNVLEGMVQNRVVSQYTRERGYGASDQQVRDYIRSFEVFQLGGEFSTQAYIATLASQGVTPEAFEAEQRNELQIAQLRQGIVGSAFFTPTEFRQFIELEQEQREVSFVLFEPAAFLDQVDISADAVQAFYEENASRFETEENVSLEYVELRLDDMAKDLSIDESALEEYYAANQERFQSAEQRRARHILISIDDDADETVALERATEIRARIAAGESFADLAQEFSADPGSAADGGELGWAGRGVYVPTFEEALFALEPGAVSEPVRTEFGYHLIELEEVESGSQQSLAEVRDELLLELQRRQAEDSYFALAERLDDLALENPGSLAAVAEQTGLELKRAEIITRAGGAPFGFNQTLVQAAFGPAVLDDGENSSLLELDDGHAVVIRVAEHRLPKALPLEDVREQIEEQLRLEAAADIARARGQEMLTALEAGGELAALAGEFGVEVQGPGPYSRRSDELPPDLLGAVFRARHPSAINATIGSLATGDGGFAVFSLANVLPGQPESLPREQRDQRKVQLAQQLGNAALAATVMDLRSAARVVVAPGLFETEENL